MSKRELPKMPRWDGPLSHPFYSKVVKRGLDLILAILDGRVPDDGTCFELVYCYAKGKRCVAYKTDARSFIDGFDNVMIHGAPETVLHNEEELKVYFTDPA